MGCLVLVMSGAYGNNQFHSMRHPTYGCDYMYFFLYVWVAFDAGQQMHQGVSWSHGPEALTLRLHQIGLVPASITLSWWMVVYPLWWWHCWVVFHQRERLNNKQIIFFCRTMHSLLQGGVSAYEALQVVGRSTVDVHLQNAIHRLVGVLGRGVSWGQAFAADVRWPVLLSLSFTATTHAGVTTEMFMHLTTVFEYREHHYRELLQTLLMPILTAGATVVIIGGFVYFSLPAHVSVIVTSINYAFYGAFFCLLVLSLYCLKYSTRLSVIGDWVMVHLPFIGAIITQGHAVIFFTVLGLLLRSGIPLVQALHGVDSLMVNRYWQLMVRQCIALLSEGWAVLDVARRMPRVCMPRAFVGALVAVSNSDQLAAVCEHTARVVSAERARLLATSVMLLQPFLMAVIGLVIVFFLRTVFESFTDVFAGVSVGTW